MKGFEHAGAYFRESFAPDLKAGFITAVVALPLAIGFAIASGVHPIMGLTTAIIAGFLGSAFGGSRFSITGPTGAMTVVILSTLHKFGMEGLLLAGFLAGLIQLILGLVKIGKYIKFIPLPIISGFTSGIGILIFTGQISNALGIKTASHEFVGDTLVEIAENLVMTNPAALIITAVTILLLIYLPRLTIKVKYLKIVPASIVALIGTTIAAYLLRETIDIPSVGAIPAGLPEFHFFNFSFSLARHVLPSAFTIALLGAIEALLCAVVCDGMTGTKHDSDRELVSQGVVNIIMPFFTGIPATAAVARSAVNIREGARTKGAGVIHAIFLLLTVLFLAPVAVYIPKAFLAGILMYVSARMVNIKEIKTIMRISKSETTALFITLGLTVLTDLVFAVQVGFVFAVFLVFIKLTNVISILHSTGDISMKNCGIRKAGARKPFPQKENVSIYSIHGPFFFGAMNLFDSKVNEQLDVKRPRIIIDLHDVPFIDSTALVRLIEFINAREKENKKVYFAGANKTVKRILAENAEFAEYLDKRKKKLFDSVDSALKFIESNA
jgi:SulP family sulfate permease